MMSAVQTPHLHMNGPMIAGGSGCTLAELAALPEHRVHSSGLPQLDDVCDGGIHSGEVWTIAAQSRMGVTALATKMAVAASQTAEVLFSTATLARDSCAAALSELLRPRTGKPRRSIVCVWLPGSHNRIGCRRRPLCICVVMSARRPSTR